MKKVLTTCFIFVCFLSISKAQNPGCDGSRYIDNVFPTFKKTTVTYAPTTSHLGGTINLMMDVYEPDGDVVVSRPVVVLAHGGSFIFGDRTMMGRYCELLAKKGYVAATISYRLFPFLNLGFPDSLDVFDTAVKAVGDMRAAVRYFREDAATSNQFKADVNHIFIGGYSAGAVTALHCAYLDGSDDVPAFLQTLIDNNGGLDGVSGTSANQSFSSSSGAVVNMSGGLYRSIWIDPNETPLVSIHGTADETVPFVSGLAANIAYLEGSSKIHAQAEQINLWNSLHIVPGGGHTNIYDLAAYAPHLDTFWVNATTLLESLTCATVGTVLPEYYDKNWQMSPNPNDGQTLNVILPEATKKVQITVYEGSGKKVFSQVFFNHTPALSLGQLTPGVYFVQPVDLLNPDNQIAPKKLIVR
ncbi:MAG: carboxylesterase family protein [Saprospiraceae bacterium]|nr:carboxylesterase family protein [Saprospiraceae bacterium]